MSITAKLYSAVHKNNSGWQDDTKQKIMTENNRKKEHAMAELY